MKEINFKELALAFSGDLFYDESTLHKAYKMIYSTDASVYQERPLAVAVPKTKEDIRACIHFANSHAITLIPRAAGTSLAGQVVGNGMVVDISRHFKNVIELNVEEQWVRVQPGIIRDDLNIFLKPHGLLFAPETSTANRALIGGMIGNNSCGLHSIVWGDTRQHLLEATVFLSDGSEAVFKLLQAQELSEKTSHTTLEGKIYKDLAHLLTDPGNQKSIQEGYPKKTLTRRNTGYALDILLDGILENKGAINLCQLLAGSEGTLGFITEAKLNLIQLPPKLEALVCIHCNSVAEALHANNVALQHSPMASELVDKYIMDFTKGHRTYQHNRFFLEGDPAALLMVEFMEATPEALNQKTSGLMEALQQSKLGYAYPVLKGKDAQLAWDIRKAGLGLIRNLPGDSQPVNLIEDCAVPPEHLPEYIDELQQLLKSRQLQASYYAHAGAGELHVEPMINLKTSEGRATFRNVLKDTVALVKKYQGSLSGEHGDGRLRGEFIPEALGPNVYALLKNVKQIFDPKGIFNDNKIVDTPPMNQQLRYEPDPPKKHFDTVFDFSDPGSILNLAEKCSGSGDCRRSHRTGGAMCPSYMATLQEKDTTRARANILRQFLTSSPKENPFDHPEIREVMDLCLSCKACKSECPTQVDVTKMKAEFLQHYYDAHVIPFRTKLIAHFTQTQKLGILVPSIYNALVKNNFTSHIIKKTIGFAPRRSLPTVGASSLKSWYKKRSTKNKTKTTGKKVYLFCDEFTNYNDVEIGKKAIWLLEALGYEVLIPEHGESGRTFLSKGLVRKAQQIITKNVKALAPLITAEAPLIGIEPSALITFKDEAIDLTKGALKEKARQLAANSFLMEEFLVRELGRGQISTTDFTEEKRNIQLQVHCYQRALGLAPIVEKAMSIPQNYQVETIASGCCGMAGSFGYEKEHFDVSLKIGELVLLPKVRELPADTLIAAPGTSCRHQIKDGAARTALHPVEILWGALRKK